MEQTIFICDRCREKEERTQAKRTWGEIEADWVGNYHLCPICREHFEKFLENKTVKGNK